MPAQAITTVFGHSLPPEGPHTITMHFPGWDVAIRFRDGDDSLMKHFTSIYPRFGPFGLTAQLAGALHKKLGLPATHGALPFTSPDTFKLAQIYALSDHRAEDKLSPGDLLFKIVDVNGVRLYVVSFPMAKKKGVVGMWQHPGTGISSRLAEALLPHVDSTTEIPFDVAGDGDVSVQKIPAATYLPEVDAHQKLRERIVGLLKRAPLTPERIKFTHDDVYLYGTGMAAIYRLNEAIMNVRSGSVAALGSLFHNTWHLFEEAPGGYKHFGQCDAKSGVMDKLEAYLQEEEKAGHKVSYVFVEFPSNPIIVSADLKRLRELADKYGFYAIIDDTIGSYCNVDLSSVADVIMTSNTKSFSGYSDVMAGSIVLNPDSPRYQLLKDSFKSLFHNEYFSGDAEKLLQNSDDYLSRSAILNRNASALAGFFQTLADDPASGVASVLYTEQADTRPNYEALMRPATAEFTPGYGCLLSVEFKNTACAKAFYDNVQFYSGPHLGAHLTIVIPFNELVWRTPDERAYHGAYGAKGQQVRIAVGLESVEDLLDTAKAGMVFVEEENAKGSA